MMKRRTFLAGTAALVPAVTLGSAALMADHPSLGLTTLSGVTMGTYFRVQFAASEHTASMVRLNVLGTVAEVDHLMSTYKPDSEVSRFNAAGVRAPVALSAPTRNVVKEALRIGALTGGAFDPTIGPLVDLWGFGAAGVTSIVPESGQLLQVSRRIGLDALHTSPVSAWKSRQNLAMDLGGIAKGYAVDQLARMLDARGVTSYLVDIGGEMRAKGRKPDGQPWRVGIEAPSFGRRAVQRVIRLDDRAVATSGDYRNYFVRDGQSYSHVIDPRTHRPVSHALASVTVVDRSAMVADALSTALMVMGPDEGFDFASKTDLAAYFLIRDGDRLIERHTRPFGPWLEGVA